MTAAKFAELNLHAFGDTVLMSGAVYQGNGRAFVVYFPGETQEHPLEHVEMTVPDWEALLRQTDLVEVEALAKAQDGTITKAFLRKSQRAVDATVNWKVFKRDGYACRYCGNDDCVLTVDHLVTWEDGGPWTMANLVTSCRKCNKVRGNTSYEQWLAHPRYRDLSKALTPAVRALNEALVATLRDIPRYMSKRSR
jgi:hypothetical protein